MTTPADPPDLAAVAGVSLRAPQARYDAGALPFGAAVLFRAEGPASRIKGLTLSLTPEAAAACAAAGGSGARSVTFNVPQWVGLFGAGMREDNPRFEGLRALLVDHALLSHPDVIERLDLTGLGAEGPARELLVHLATLRGAVVEGGLRDQPRECPECAAVRHKDEEVRAAAARAEAQRALAAAKTPREVQSIRAKFYSVLYGVSPAWSGAAPRDCPHRALAAQAMEALCARFPEVMLELVEMLRCAGHGVERFVLAAPVMDAGVSRWLTGRARRRDDGWGYRPQRAWKRTVRVRDAARAAVELPPEQRVGVSYAASAWAYAAPVGTLGSNAALPASDDATPTLHDDDERIDVERMLPSFARPRPEPPRPAPRPAPPAAPAKATKPHAKRPAAKVKAAAPEKKPAAEAPALDEATRALLRGAGISDALIDEMVREGRLGGGPRGRR